MLLLDTTTNHRHRDQSPQKRNRGLACSSSLQLHVLGEPWASAQIQVTARLNADKCLKCQQSLMLIIHTLSTPDVQEVRLTFCCQFFKNMTCISAIPFLLKDKLQGFLQVTAVLSSKWSLNPLTYVDTLLKTLSVSPYCRRFGPRLFLGEA